MAVEKNVRGVAGFVVLSSLTLAVAHHINWLVLALFVGLSLLLEPALTNWFRSCPFCVVSA